MPLLILGNIVDKAREPGKFILFKMSWIRDQDAWLSNFKHSKSSKHLMHLLFSIIEEQILEILTA